MHYCFKTYDVGHTDGQRWHFHKIYIFFIISENNPIHAHTLRVGVKQPHSNPHEPCILHVLLSQKPLSWAVFSLSASDSHVTWSCILSCADTHKHTRQSYANSLEDKCFSWIKQLNYNGGLSSYKTEKDRNNLAFSFLTTKLDNTTLAFACIHLADTFIQSDLRRA